MKIKLKKAEVDALSNIHKEVLDYLRFTGEVSITDYEKAKNVKELFKSNSIIRFDFIHQEYVIKINADFITEMINEYKDLVMKLLPSLYGMVPLIKTMYASIATSTRKFANIYEKFLVPEQKDSKVEEKVSETDSEIPMPQDEEEVGA